MTEAIYLEVTEKTEAAKKAGRQVSVSGMLKFSGVSRSLRISCMAPSRNYKISLMSNLILIVRMQSGVRILPTYKTAHAKAELLAG